MNMLDLLLDRWPEAEETIQKSPRWSYYYAIDVLKSRMDGLMQDSWYKKWIEMGFISDPYKIGI